MRFLKHVVAALSLSLLAAGAGASPDKPQDGTDYRTLQKPQQTEAGQKVEVIEFFWYSCPHCFALEHDLVAWLKKQGDNVVFKRIPVAFRDSMVPQQKLFYTLEAMGKFDELHQKLFNTIHVERKRTDTDAEILDFVTRNGIDKQKFLDVYNSFGVQAKAKRATQLMQAYQVDGVPLLAVGGRYLTSPAIIAEKLGNRPEPVLHQATFQVMDFLVKQSRQAK
ncbi:MAG TPA: thiol:disulfide interchange protein DsbA/DsbL [Noviherbaspirillum sp.]|jgi:thiol:disulfide interchange protein DsbA|uniref:thiol:disulfide interchange protein DsbA/DsbL n=1 Tax=Noviherbaspirillum sp. TaxID=1926288 RepID=UPI002F959E7C